MRLRLAPILLGLAALSLCPPRPVEAASGLEEVSRALMCTCGCTMILNTCTCATADAMRQEIQTRLDGGMTPGQIIAEHVSRYGEKVLAAPPKRGFNLTAWTLPFAAVLGFGLLVALTARRWAARAAAPSPAPLTQAEEQLLAEALDDYLGGEPR